MEYISKSEKETVAIAEKIASKCLPGNVYALFGELGSGKTTFTKGFAKKMGIKEEITSPTFVIMKQYKIMRTDKNIDLLSHIDCYRFSNADDAESVGLSEIFSKISAVSIIEWPEKIGSLLPNHAIKIKFKYLDENTRKITIN